MTGRPAVLAWVLLAALVAVVAFSEYRAAARTFARVSCQLTVHVGEFGGQSQDPPAACGRVG